jgi:hypothetical protein
MSFKNKAQPIQGLNSDNQRVVFRTEDGNLTTYLGSVNSEGNTTTTPLLIGEEYTGEWELNSHNDVMVSLKTDQIGKLYFDFSNDGVNVETFPTSGFDVTTDHEFHTAIKGKRYFRIRLDNTSGIDQTVLRLHTYYGSYRQANSPLNHLVTDNSDSIVVKSVSIGKTESDEYVNVGVTDDGELFTNTKASNRQTRAQYTSGLVTTDTYALLVDLSSEPYTNYVSLDNLNVNCHLLAANSSTIIKIGVITRIDAVNADLSWLVSLPFSTANTNTYLSHTNNYQPSAVQFRVSGGSLVNAYTNDTSLNVALVNTALTLPSPRGSVTPAVGDVIMLFDHTGDNFNSTVGVIYHTD